MKTIDRLAIFILAATGLLLAWAPAGQAAEKVRDLPIIDRAIDFHGGDLYLSTRTSLTVGSRSGAFDVVSTMDGDNFEHVVSGKSSDGAVRKVRQTNSAIEEWSDGEPVTLDEEGRRRAQAFVEARVYFPFLPFRLNDPSVWKEDQGIEDWDGKKLHRVKVTFDAGSSNSAHDQYVFWFDPESARLEQYAYSFGTGRERGGLRLRKPFDYRRFGGILFFDVDNLGVNGSGKELTVDLLTPGYVKEKMEHVSFVNLSNIKVRATTAER